MRKKNGGLCRIATAVFFTAVSFGSFSGSAEAAALFNTNSVTAGGALFTLTDCKFNTLTCTGAEGEFNAWAGHGSSIKITGPGGGNLLSAGLNEVNDLTLLFTVTTPTARMISVQATMGASAFADGGAFMDETITSNPPAINYSLTLTRFGATSDLSDTTPDFAAQSELALDKDISVYGPTTAADPSTIAFVTQSVTQVPEPSGLTLLLVAGAAAFGFRRRAAQVRS